MRRTFSTTLLLFGTLLMLASTLQGDVFDGDVFDGERFVDPEIVLKHREAIGLSDEQFESIREKIRKLSETLPAKQQALKSANQKLSKQLGGESVDEDVAAKQFGDMLSLEREMKLAHFRLLVQIRSELSQSQYETAYMIQTASQKDMKRLGERIQIKIEKIQAEVQARAQRGVPPNEVFEFMRKVPPLMEAGKPLEANALLNEVLKKLDLKVSNPRKAAHVESKPIDNDPVLSYDDVRKKIDGLKKPDIAWRKIKWKTCLVEGLIASREQKKPLLLWVFIDRPIDDERC